MKKSTKFSPEVRERAVRMVQEHHGEYPSLWAAIESIAPKIGCVPQTLNEWVRRDEVDAGTRQGVSSAEHQRVKALEREVKELRRANEILKLASAFFAQAVLFTCPPHPRHAPTGSFLQDSDSAQSKNPLKATQSSGWSNLVCPLFEQSSVSSRVQSHRMRTVLNPCL